MREIFLLFTPYNLFLLSFDLPMKGNILFSLKFERHQIGVLSFSPSRRRNPYYEFCIPLSNDDYDLLPDSSGGSIIVKARGKSFSTDYLLEKLKALCKPTRYFKMACLGNDLHCKIRKRVRYKQYPRTRALVYQRNVHFGPKVEIWFQTLIRASRRSSNLWELSIEFNNKNIMKKVGNSI